MSLLLENAKLLRPNILQDSTRFHEILSVRSKNFPQVPSVSMKFEKDCLGIPHQDIKACICTIGFVFGIEINTYLCVTQIAIDKLERARNATGEAFFKQALPLRKVQSLTGFLSFCAQVV